MTYRAPVPDIVFTMRHVAGLDRAVADGLYGDLSADLAQTILEEAGRFANDVIAPLNREGDQARRDPEGRRRDHRAGLEGRLPGLDGGRLERAARSGRLRRAGPADAAQLGLRRDVELRLHGLRHRPGADHGRHRGADPRTAPTS